MSMAFGPQTGCIVNASGLNACSTRGSCNPTAAANASSSHSQISYHKGYSFKSLSNHVATYVIFIQSTTVN
jgi:hypothetical protein